MNVLRRKKFRARIAANPRNVRFEELIRFVEAYGYTCRPPSSGSSHYTCRKPGRLPIVIVKPESNRVKEIYVKMALKETEDLEDDCP